MMSFQFRVIYTKFKHGAKSGKWSWTWTKPCVWNFLGKKITRHLSYTINNATLSPVTEYKYLGVYFTPSLCWHRQVDYTVAKSSWALGFLRRNTCDFPQAVKALLYKSNVRSVLEYACTVWDPPIVIDKQKLERVQNLAVRYVLGKHARNKEYSATFSIQTLQWEILEHRRSKLCLKLFHEIYFSKTGVLREEYIASPHYTSARMDHAYKVREYKCNTESFSSSFFPKTIRQWNRLSSAVVSRIGSNSFYDALSETALSTKKNWWVWQGFCVCVRVCVYVRRKYLFFSFFAMCNVHFFCCQPLTLVSENGFSCCFVV